MDRQMERILFGDDSGTQQRSEEGQRSLAKEARQLADEPREANANKRASVTIEGMRAILSQQDYRCALSGVVLSPDCASLDHIRPLSKGGQHVLSNIQIVHTIVNGLKGEMTQDEFIQWAKLIASNKKEDIDFA